MKVFLYEHATCCERLPDSIAVEGLAMFLAALGMSKLCDVVSYVREEFRHLGFPCNGRFEDFVEESDAFLIIAPENDFTLLELTSTAERIGGINLGSSSKAIAVTSDKWRLYKKLKRKVNVPRTSKKPLDCRFIVKPRTSCGGDGIRFAAEVGDGFVAQEYVPGVPLSVSVLVGDDVLAVSVNEQILDGFEYVGGVVPAKINEIAYAEVVEEAISAVEAIRGLFGYVGVDIVYAERPYVIEVNARLTTPAVAFKWAYGVSVGELIWKNAFSSLTPLETKRVCMIKKSCEGSVIARVGDRCLSIT